MVKAADLTIIRSYDKNNRVCIDARAENGMEATFALSNKRGDSRGELNENGRIKRFARENRLNPIETEETEVANTYQTMPKSPPKLEAVTTPAERELTMREFYKLCEAVKSDAAKYSTIEAVALDATRALGVPVSVESVREAMEAAGVPEPKHWKPLDPLAAIAIELKTFMDAIGTKPSTQFLNALKALEQA